MAQPPAPQEPNTVGNASLWLGIASSALVFGIGLCALTGAGQRWLQIAGTPLFVCGGASAFLGVLAILLGAVALLGKPRPRTTAIVGLILGSMGACLFFVFLNLIGRAAG